MVLNYEALPGTALSLRQLRVLIRDQFTRKISVYLVSVCFTGAVVIVMLIATSKILTEVNSCREPVKE